MSSYREDSNKAKAKKLGIIDAKVTGKGKKKAKVKGPWKVMWTWREGKPSVRHHCATKELAEKLLAKHMGGWDNERRAAAGLAHYYIEFVRD